MEIKKKIGEFVEKNAVSISITMLAFVVGVHVGIDYERYDTHMRAIMRSMTEGNVIYF